MNQNVCRESDLERFLRAALAAGGADTDSAEAAARAMMHASRLGVDSHGLRLLPHYLKVLAGGRVNPRPKMKIHARAQATAWLDADHGLGHLAGYTAMAEAVRLAEGCGIGAVAVGNSSHFGAAGAYALAAAEAGCIGLAVCNSDSIVQLFDGVMAFHGTNPLAFAAPLPEGPPYLIDMATSSIPWNRVLQYAALDQELPADVVVDEAGQTTTDGAAAKALKPLGADYGYKGAALAGMVEILSAALTGMAISFQVPAMMGPDFSTPRRLGQFFLALRPEAFVPREDYESQMTDYLTALRAQPAVENGEVLAPGDREWREAEHRREFGIPIDNANRRTFDEIAQRLRIEPLKVESGLGAKTPGI